MSMAIAEEAVDDAFAKINETLARVTRQEKAAASVGTSGKELSKAQMRPCWSNAEDLKLPVKTYIFRCGKFFHNVWSIKCGTLSTSILPDGFTELDRSQTGLAELWELVGPYLDQYKLGYTAFRVWAAKKGCLGGEDLDLSAGSGFGLEEQFVCSSASMLHLCRPGF